MGRSDLELKLKNEISEIGRMADELQTWGKNNGIPPSALNDISVALDDLAVNIINYAFLDKKQHDIFIILHRDNTSVTCTITDDGIPFDPIKKEIPNIKAPIEQRKIGGLGVHIAKTLMDEIHYERSGDKNILTIYKSL